MNFISGSEQAATTMEEKFIAKIFHAIVTFHASGNAEVGDSEGRPRQEEVCDSDREFVKVV